MIQRIQTIYLFLSSVVMSFLFFHHMASIEFSGRMEEVWLYGIKESGSGEIILHNWTLMALPIVIILIYLLAIFLYQKRELQMRFVVYGIILTIALMGLGALFVIQRSNAFDGSVKMEYFSIMPLVSMILSILAWRGIRRDYLMLKAVDRIR